MHEIRQFRPTLYVLLIVTIIGYGVALESFGHLVFGLTLVLLHWVLTSRGMRFLLPRVVSSGTALVTGIWSTWGLLQATMTPLLAISQWLFFLMLVTLWSKQDNRAYAQMLVMTLVLMIAGAINSASVIFGFTLIVYLILGLFVSLLFHLKVERDGAVRTYDLPKEKIETMSAGFDRIAFSRSLRRLTIVVSSAALFTGVMVFLFFPRSSAPTSMFRIASMQSAPLTGFSERVSFEQVARITQNEEVIAHITLLENGQVSPARDLYLRGMTLDVYTGLSTRRSAGSWQWLRSNEIWNSAETFRATGDQTVQFGRIPGARQIVQRVLLKPTGTSALFGVDGITGIRTDRNMDVQFFTGDGTLRSSETLREQIQYEITSTGEPPPPYVPARRGATPYAGLARDYTRNFGLSYGSRIEPRIAEYARRPEVSGRDNAGPLIEQRGDSPGPHALDGRIAESISRHLQTEFTYTLDLTDARIKPGEDPLGTFLYDFKRGHCEYFAGAMALMSQSLGLRARVVIGFRVGPEDFNQLGGYYVVRQSHAHSWVEVLTTGGWKSFDPTAGEYYAMRKRGGLFKSVGDFFDLLQYKWATSVVTYNNESRKSVWESFESGVTGSFQSGGGLMTRLRDVLKSETIFEISTRIIMAAIAVSITALLVAVGYFIVEKHRLYKRAQRMGLSSLPSDEQLRLARELVFYDRMLQALHKRSVYRSASMTPREFARALSFLPPGAYEDVQRLTQIFYEVRFGARRLGPISQRKLTRVVERLERALAPATA